MVIYVHESICELESNSCVARHLLRHRQLTKNPTISATTQRHWSTTRVAAHLFHSHS